MAPEQDDDKTVIRPSTNATMAPTPTAGRTAFAEGHNALPAGTSLGEFEITGLIGEGGFGIVYLAYDHSLGRKVALKEYMPAALAARTHASEVAVKSERHAETFRAGLRSFVNEARLLAQFDHASLVKVYRFWEANGTAYMVMPYYEGVTLKQRLAELREPPGEAWLKALLAPLMDALEAIHREQCFHRDIAPDNILLLKDGRPLLLDFGAARRVIGDMTQALTVILKPGYAPVEQYAEVASMKQGAWTDIYALAAVVYYAIMGKTPPPSVGRMMHDDLVPLARAAAGRYSDAFLRGLDRALAVKPEDRPQSMADLRKLLGIEGSERAPQRQVDLAPRERVSNTKWLLAGGFAMLALVAGGLYIAFGPATQNQPPGSPSPMTPVPAPTPAPLPPPEPPAQPQTVKPFNPVAALDEMFEQRNREHSVAVELDQSAVRIGKDRLRFRLRSSRPGYLYVFMVGTDGEHFNLLFPNAVDGKNRVEAGKDISLPRPGWTMTAGGPPGINHFLAVVSESPREFSAAGLKKIDPFAEFPLPQAEKLARASAGAPSPFLGKAKCPPGVACADAFGAAIFTIEEVK